MPKRFEAAARLTLFDQAFDNRSGLMSGFVIGKGERRLKPK
jgi:hypothetical protein